jgi:DNA ligase-1
MTLYEIIKALQSASGSNAKTAILEEHKDNELLKAYLKATYDPAISYYITKVNKSSANEGFSFHEDIIDTLIHYLAKRTVTGNNAKIWLEDYITTFSMKAQELIELMLKRSIGAGVGDTMILKVFPDLYFIPPYQRCSLMDDKIRAKFDKLEEFAVQLKADGSFCYLVNDGDERLITRAGNIYPKEICHYIAGVTPANSVLIGELEVYKDGELLDRSTGNGLLNSYMKGTLPDNDITISLNAWDILTIPEFKAGKSDIPYLERFNRLKELWYYVIPTTIVDSLDQAYKIYSDYTSQGKEGAVIKTLDFKWKDGTSKDCIKLKIEFEVDLEVVAIHEGTGKAKGMMGSITLKSGDGGLITDCGSGFSDTDRMDWWLNSEERIGSIITVKANDIVSKRDSKIASLFLPIFVEERLDKKEADSYARCVYQLEAAKNGWKA